jgi:hypothetical protein
LATLHVFGDESGTMPTDDRQEPFVIATVAFLERVPSLIAGTNLDQKLVEVLTQYHGIPFAAIVKPFPGYGYRLMSRFEDLKANASEIRLAKGMSDQTFDSDMSIRNHVWSHAMQQAIVHTVNIAMLVASIDALRILLHEKTMTLEMRGLFASRVLNVGERVKMFLHDRSCPEGMRWYESNIQFTKESVSLSWSDENPPLKKEFGLKLADRLSRKIYRDFSKPGEACFRSLLVSAGFEDFMIDISDIITRPWVKRQLLF